jgi:hypothetical protein
MSQTLIGRGVLTWGKLERISDRYGTVRLLQDGTEAAAELKIPSGHGTLVALVVEARASDHIGDLFRGIYPITPTTGDRLELGTGDVFAEKVEGALSIGVKPDDGRKNDWLKPELLYRCHNSLVELWWETEEQGHAE